MMKKIIVMVAMAFCTVARADDQILTNKLSSYIEDHCTQVEFRYFSQSGQTSFELTCDWQLIISTKPSTFVNVVSSAEDANKMLPSTWMAMTRAALKVTSLREVPELASHQSSTQAVNGYRMMTNNPAIHIEYYHQIAALKNLKNALKPNTKIKLVYTHDRDEKVETIQITQEDQSIFSYEGSFDQFNFRQFQHLSESITNNAQDIVAKSYLILSHMCTRTDSNDNKKTSDPKSYNDFFGPNQYKLVENFVCK